MDDSRVSDRFPFEVYRKFGIGEHGMAVLIRPDGYISMGTAVDYTGAGKILTFLRSL